MMDKLNLFNYVYSFQNFEYQIQAVELLLFLLTKYNNKYMYKNKNIGIFIYKCDQNKPLRSQFFNQNADF